MSQGKTVTPIGCKGPPLQGVGSDAVALNGFCKSPFYRHFRGGAAGPNLPARTSKSGCSIQILATDTPLGPICAGLSVKLAGSEIVAKFRPDRSALIGS